VSRNEFQLWRFQAIYTPPSGKVEVPLNQEILANLIPTSEGTYYGCRRRSLLLREGDMFLLRIIRDTIYTVMAKCSGSENWNIWYVRLTLIFKGLKGTRRKERKLSLYFISMPTASSYPILGKWNICFNKEVKYHTFRRNEVVNKCQRMSPFRQNKEEWNSMRPIYRLLYFI
jgi:hypothetical protein